jgi:UDP-N-acetylmuramoyl-L-alanyl-D-glutamate--2,6-diaminopimelate ligase
LEHIEAHGGFGKYRKAKLNFFRYVASKKTLNSKPKIFIINKDDRNAKYFIEAVASSSLFSVRDDGKDKEIILYNKSELPSNLIGEFNQYNVGAAAAFVKAVNVDEKIVKKAIAEFPGVPGRMEFIQKEPFMVIVDYAHTPDSLRSVYQTLRKESGNSKLVCVFGAAGGGRDKWKRPEMGKIAAEYCDEIILTNEDPYDENPDKILDQISSGFSQIRNPKSEIRKIIDRKDAIKKAIELAREGDTVIITGKGSEQWMHLAYGQKIPWSDRQTAQRSCLYSCLEEISDGIIKL